MAHGPSITSKPRVLVIERDVDLQKKIAHSLEDTYRIDLTSSGSLALILMKDYRYSCIVASYELPNRHRSEGILQAVRGMPGGRYVPVVAIGRTDPDAQREEALTNGFAEYVSVPSQVRRLGSVVHGVVRVWD